MRRLLVAALLVVVGVGPGSAQQSSVYSTAVPPDRSALDRVNLRNEWTARLPLDGRHDAVGPVQMVDGDQIFVQTRSGLLLALDANTGAAKWNYRLPAGYVTLHPVAVNENFVFVVNVAKLFCIHRYSGVVEFEYEIPGTPTVGPMVDKELVYIVLNGNRIIAYRFPTIFRIADVKGAVRPGEKPPQNPVDALASRYSVGAAKSMLNDQAVDRPKAPEISVEPVSGLAALQRTPSLSALPSITPPYTLENRALYKSPSLSVLPTLRQPYQFRPDYLQFNQLTPSVAVLPPSVARLQELANFRPRGVEPTVDWVYASTRRIAYEPIRISALHGDGTTTGVYLNRLWFTTDTTHIMSLSASTAQQQVGGQLQDRVAASMGGPLPYTRADLKPNDPDAKTYLGFVSLLDGNVLALDLLGGNTEGPKIEWRANVGGLMNHRPVATPDAVYVSGENAGIVRIDTATGDVAWRSEPTVDRVLAVNQEFVYAQDRVGNLHIFDRSKSSDGTGKRLNSLAKLPLSGFAVPVTNHVNDRILIASDSGTMICLRDASTKYARPMAVIPPPAPTEKKDEKKDGM